MNGGARAASAAMDEEVQVSAFPGGGEMGALVRAFDWSHTGLGPFAAWPESLKAVTRTILASPVPMVLLWGEDGVMIYNDGYRTLAADRHPGLLGARVRDGWPEAADFNAEVIRTVLSGRPLTYKDREFTLRRGGAAERAWFDLYYSPVLDGRGVPAGVLGITIETSERVRATRRRDGEHARLTRLFEQSPNPIAILRGPQHVFELVNPACSRLIGHRDVVGRPIAEALPEAARDGFVAVLDRVYRDGRAHVESAVRFAGRDASGAPVEDRYLDFAYQPVTDADGRVGGVFVEGYDVTQRAVAETKVRESETRFRALVTATSEMVYRMSPDWTEMRHLDGRDFLSDAEIPSVAWHDVYLFPEDQPLVLAAIRRAIESKSVFQLEHRVRRVDGTTGWVITRAIPLVDKDGNITEWFGTANDVTDRHKVEQHLRLVVNELNHRVKNNLAMMQAIAAQTFRRVDDLPRAQASFNARIQALAQANDLLTGERWAAVSLQGVIEQALRLQCQESDRCAIAGPPVDLSPKTALSLSMAMHELATNAIKYGAWSVAEGKVSVTWSLYTGGDGTQRIRLEWRESGGPPVTPPRTRGFGSRLIERGLAPEMGGSADMRFLPEGFVCVVDAPLSVYGDK